MKITTPVFLLSPFDPNLYDIPHDLRVNASYNFRDISYLVIRSGFYR